MYVLLNCEYVSDSVNYLVSCAQLSLWSIIIHFYVIVVVCIAITLFIIENELW